jgi:hypothetical protein
MKNYTSSAFMVFYEKTVQDRLKEVGEEARVNAVFDLVRVVQPSETMTDYNNTFEAGLNSGILKLYG